MRNLIEIVTGWLIDPFLIKFMCKLSNKAALSVPDNQPTVIFTCFVNLKTRCTLLVGTVKEKLARKVAHAKPMKAN